MFRDLDVDPRDGRPDRGRPDPGRGGRPEQTGREVWDADPRGALAYELDLPRGTERERVQAPERAYELSGGDVRTMAAVGAFRAVPEADLRAYPDVGRRDIRRLRELGLVDTQPHVTRGHRTTLVTLTKQGRAILERARERDPHDERGQIFYTGISKPRELSHDAQLFRAYTRAATRIAERGGHVRRVILEEELKRSYQEFLHERNRRRPDSDGRPERSAAEIAEWAWAQQLPLDDGHVQFPDVRIEYDDRDLQRGYQDLEVTTPHYRGAHAAGRARAGFTRYRAGGARLGGTGGRGRGGRGFGPRLAEEMLGD